MPGRTAVAPAASAGAARVFDELDDAESQASDTTSAWYDANPQLDRPSWRVPPVGP